MSTRLTRIDSVRFLAAVMVFASHGGAPQLSETLNPAWLGHLYWSAYNGVAAVIVFFVVSGCCIHLPNVDRTAFDIIPFYLRRFIRIGGPAVALSVILFLADSVHVGSTDGKFWHGTYFNGLTRVSWSLVAEVIYYTFYPIIFELARRFGIKKLIMASVVASLGAITLSGSSKTHFSSYSVPVMSVMGLPFWLTGCLLAESVIRRIKSDTWIWASRCTTFSYLFIMQYLVISGTSTFPEPMAYLPFAPIVYWWLKSEFVIGGVRGSVPLLEWAGTWSYALYLVHNPLMTFFDEVLKPMTGESFLIRFTGVLVGAYVFARCVEWPFQHFAGVAAHAWTSQFTSKTADVV